MMSISSVDYTTKSNSTYNFPSLKKIDLSSEDVFHLEPLEKIQYERFKRGLEFYICVVQEEGHQFVFEGSRFIEAFLRGNKSLKNPLTKRVIEDFTVYISTKESPELVAILNKDEALKPINYLPILFNDHSRPDIERGEFYSRFAECFIMKEISLQYWFIGAVLRDENSKTNILVFSSKHRVPKYIKLLINKALNEKSKNSETLNFLGNCFSSCFFLKKRLNYSFYYYQQAALLGNSCGIGQMIYAYEKGLGVEKNQDKAGLWRTFMPKEWQEKPIEEYLKVLGKDPDMLGKTEKLEIPKELSDPEPGTKEPDPDKLFPGVKDELEKELSNIYIAERWEKQQQDRAKIMRIRSVPNHSSYADEVIEIT